MAQYASVMSEYTSMRLSVPKYDWPLLNIAECFWVCLELPEKTVLTMSGFPICLIILYVWQGFEYVSGIKCAWVLKMPDTAVITLLLRVMLLYSIWFLVCLICTFKHSATNHFISF